MKYRLKPEVVDAVQWKDGVLQDTCPKWFSEALYKDYKEVGAVIRFADKVHIRTAEGISIASDGDWIIRDCDGQIKSCKPEVFAKSYDPVSDYRIEEDNTGRISLTKID